MPGSINGRDAQSVPSLVRVRIWRTDQTMPYEAVIELPPEQAALMNPRSLSRLCASALNSPRRRGGSVLILALWALAAPLRRHLRMAQVHRP